MPSKNLKHQTMYSAWLSGDLDTEWLANGVRCLLPWRQLGKVRRFGWLVLIFGLFATGFMLIWTGIPITNGIWMLGRRRLVVRIDGGYIRTLGDFRACTDAQHVGRRPGNSSQSNSITDCRDGRFGVVNG